MAVTYSTAAKTARMQAVIDEIDAGAGVGILDIGTSGMGTVLVSIPLVKPCGVATSAVLDFDFAPDITANATATGTAAEARITDSVPTTVISGLTVGTSGTDIVLDSVSITSGQAVTITLGSITHA